MHKQEKKISSDERSVVENYKLKVVGVRLVLRCSVRTLMLSRGFFSQLLIPKSWQDDGSSLPSRREGWICWVLPGSPAHGAQPDAVSASSKLFSSPTGGSPLNFLSFLHSEHPKIWLPRALRQTYIRKVGEAVNLLIPFQVIMPAPC